jgi:hypothetical protein
VWETTDPDGRPVILTPEGWAHIFDRHEYIGVTRDDMVEIVHRPDRRRRGLRRDEEWFYRRGLGPSAWIRVVVHYAHGRGLIVTAFPRRSFP